MAPVANTYQTYQTIGIREQLANVIFNISPTETPFVRRAGKGEKLENTYFEWQQDALAAADGTNAAVEGDETSFPAVAPTVRLGNRTQIVKKALILSGTAEAVNKAGRKSEESYQIVKRGKELKRDIETICLRNQAAVAGDSVTARTTASMLAYLKTNVDKEATGVNPVYTTTPDDPRTDGVARLLTEEMLKDTMQLVWTEGASPSVIMVGAFNKRVISGFEGIAALQKQHSG